MKSIAICGSIIAAADEILKIQKVLEEKGFSVEIPDGVKRYNKNNSTHVAEEESVARKIESDLIRRYFNKIKEYDAVLIVNTEKKGIPGYIGGNTFLEMGFAHVLNKPLFVLNPLPQLSYTSEIEAMKPVVINGDLERIK